MWIPGVDDRKDPRPKTPAGTAGSAPKQPGSDNYQNTTPAPAFPSAVTPTTDPNIDSVLNRQLATAREFRAGIPAQSDRLYGDYAGQSRRNLAGSLKAVDKDFNRRGLLHSGMRTGAQYGVQADASNDLAQARQSINQGLLSQADVLEGNAVNTAGTQAGLGVGLGNALTGAAQNQLNLNAQSAATNRQMANNFGQAGGTLAGIMARQRYGGDDFTPDAANTFGDSSTYWKPQNSNTYPYSSYNGVQA